MNLIRAGLTVAWLVALCAIAKADCQKSDFRFTTVNTRVQSAWRVQENTACSSSISSENSLFLSHWKILNRPQHGTTGIQSGVTRSFAYRPIPGYVGPDVFIVSFEVNHPDHTTDYRVVLTVTIDVVPSL